nr:CCE006l-like protein [Helicoverpa armigera]
MILKLMLFIYLINNHVIGDLSLQTAVDTPVGQILGLVRDEYKAFFGIPYGVVDENNPFAKAKPHPHFETPFPATSDAVMCPQYFKGMIKGTLQCLNLNIYTPIEIGQQALPVMVYIHGGAFAEGNVAEHTYPPTFLIQHDVIVVMMYYRLGPYGHLCIPKYGNQAFYDQQLALKWVKSNIAAFGGDSENILLFGHSSGSISVEFQMFNNNNLFKKVILQSGNAVMPFITEITDVSTLIKDVGMDPENVDYDNFVQTLSRIPTDTLINMTIAYNFRPCIDNDFIHRETKVNLQNMKIMIGGTTRESLYFYPQEIDDSFDYTRELEKGFFISNNNEIQDGGDDAVRLVKDFYSYNPKDNLVDFVSDLLLTIQWRDLDPTPSKSSVLPDWPPVTASETPYLVIDKSPRIDSAPFTTRMAFWDAFYDKYGKYWKGISLGEPWHKKLVNSGFKLDLSHVLLGLSLFFT